MKENKFLDDLLILQPDGREAISAPSNWGEPPLLKVSTELDGLIEGIVSGMLLRTGTESGRWHFFIGSPGNGKSTATGEIAHQLLRLGCTLKADLPRGMINLDELEKGEIPYVIKVWEQGNRFETAWIAQDASVVRDPWSSKLDPAEDLLQLLDEAWKKGVSLVVCANRGVIETAARDTRFKNEEWHSILGQMVENPQVSEEKIKAGMGTTRFKTMTMTSCSLDRRSLLLGTDTFRDLIDTATEHNNWSICEECSSCKLCPFKANRDWLSDPKGQEVILDLLSCAEVLSGQIIVMREALALISTVLAGCPRDFTGTIKGPCQWVYSKVEEKDTFALASRRIYMIIFASHTPRGLEISAEQRQKQHEGLRMLQEKLAGKSETSESELKHVTSGESSWAPLSTELGIPHLLGARGTFQSLDPLKCRLEEDFFKRWHPCSFEIDEPLSSPLESAMQESWQQMYDVVEESSEDARQMMFWLTRWSSAFTIRLGGLYDQRLNLGQSLMKMKRFISGNREERRELRYGLDDELPALLGYRHRSDNFKVALNDHVILKGSWVGHRLHPKVVGDDMSDQDKMDLGLRIKFGGRQSNNTQLLPTEVFHWLHQRMIYGLLLECFPRHLLEAAETFLVRMASRSNYSLEEDDVILEIHAADDRVFTLSRRYGEVKLDIN